MNANQVIEIFIEQRIIERGQVDDITAEVISSGKNIVEIMVDLGFVTEDQFYQALATYLGTEYVDLLEFEPPADILALVPSSLARLHGALPIGLNGSAVTLAMIDPLNSQVQEDIRFALGRDIYIVVASIVHVQNLIQRCYGMDSSSLDDVLSELGSGVQFGSDGVDLKAIEAEANSTPIIRYVDLVLAQAIADRASDIHFEPFETEFKIRYRVDGALYEMAPPPIHLALPVISRIKVMSNMNIAERRLPQDGRIQLTTAGRQVDLRVSSLPTQYGESVVLRVLDRSTVNLSLKALGMPEYIYNYILETIQKPNGIFIVTGPTGSGKTTTLYACLNEINTMDSKILSAEDPVEYDIEGIIQVPIQEGIGLNFARVLRAFLRQDPDRIMVGETRDVETAQISIQASLTGHLVFTTLHTNDAPGAITRLIDMGVEPFMISASIEAVLAQRLIRRICPKCRTPYEPNEAVLSQLGLSPHDIGDKNFYYGKGCDSCNHTGYKGRKGIYELLDISDPIRELINERSPSVVLRQKAIELGMQTLRQDGLRSIYDGETTIEEILKYT